MSGTFSVKTNSQGFLCAIHVVGAFLEPSLWKTTKLEPSRDISEKTPLKSSLLAIRSQTSYCLRILWHLGGTARLVKSKVFMMPLSASVHEVFDIEHSFCFFRTEGQISLTVSLEGKMESYLACCATTCLVWCFEHLMSFCDDEAVRDFEISKWFDACDVWSIVVFVCVACGLLRLRRREICRKGNKCCCFLAQVDLRVKAGNCLLTIPDNRCFLAFLFWLVTEGEGT